MCDILNTLTGTVEYGMDVLSITTTALQDKLSYLPIVSTTKGITYKDTSSRQCETNN